MSVSNSHAREFRLRVERGQTKFPERPINSDRFLIGAGSNCHLQLGGEMPILHSIIITADDGLWIDAAAPDPPLFINRRHVREGELHPGDLIEIGSFLFRVEAQAVPVSESLIDEGEPVDLNSLSAEELVDLLQLEMDSLDAVDEAKANGAAALMQAVANVSAQQTADETDSAPENPAELLLRRAEQLKKFEADLNSRAEQLREAQDRLTALLLELSARKPTDGDSDDPMRKTA